MRLIININTKYYLMIISYFMVNTIMVKLKRKAVKIRDSAVLLTTSYIKPQNLFNIIYIMRTNVLG